MKPQTKAEWRVILDLFKMIRTATPEERRQMLDLWNRYEVMKKVMGTSEPEMKEES